MTTAQEFAARLNGRPINKEMTKDEEAEAKAAGLVVVFGYSDDNVELRGAIYDEIGAYEGATFAVSPAGLLGIWPEYEPVDIEFAREYFKREAAGVQKIAAVWRPKGSVLSWAYETDIPHATFDVIEDGEPWCRGIVFALADVAKSSN